MSAHFTIRTGWLGLQAFGDHAVPADSAWQTMKADADGPGKCPMTRNLHRSAAIAGRQPQPPISRSQIEI